MDKAAKVYTFYIFNSEKKKKKAWKQHSNYFNMSAVQISCVESQLGGVVFLFFYNRCLI